MGVRWPDFLQRGLKIIILTDCCTVQRLFQSETIDMGFRFQGKDVVTQTDMRHQRKSSREAANEDQFDENDSDEPVIKQLDNYRVSIFEVTVVTVMRFKMQLANTNCLFN